MNQYTRDFLKLLSLNQMQGDTNSLVIYLCKSCRLQTTNDPWTVKLKRQNITNMKLGVFPANLIIDEI